MPETGAESPEEKAGSRIPPDLYVRLEESLNLRTLLLRLGQNAPRSGTDEQKPES